MNDSSWLELRKFVSPEVVMGQGAVSLAGRYARNLGAEKVLVVSDAGVVRAGWAGRVIKCIEDEGLQCSLFSGVTPNPRAEEVMLGAEFYRKEGCDILVAVGGGSAIDCAKGIGIVSHNRKNILDYVGVDLIPLPGPPLICVPTTGSAADVSQFCIVTDTRRKLKVSIVSKTLVPDATLIDPFTTRTMSREQTAYTHLDSLSQAMEAYVSNASSPVTDLLALKGLELISRHLVPAMREPDNLDLRGKISLGSLEAGLAFTNASLGLVHAMSHSLGGYTDLAHGLCNSILLPWVVRFNYDASPDRYDTIGETMGADLTGLGPEGRKEAIFDAVKQLRSDAGATMTLSQAGITKEDLPELAGKTMNDVCIVTNPRHATVDEIITIFEEAL